ncbi:uncharacterized protein N7483_006344 [Penicillium malachiteum]|uniref:uncharacterized protein n=1 Tax=Penicillium malachiteum TaxID=1324776 RepID=UPI0025495BB8|nr:uncharacterized protein N7483_006344 [Penicillium malachiteum]KAJ5724987.1 hypothetical protein N7483_006344 [Penicillium malachiteum]
MLLPPVPPSHDAIAAHDFYHHHRAGCAAGALLLMVSGFIYVPYAAVIPQQMRLIPTLDSAIPSLQLAISAASVLGFVVPAMGLVNFIAPMFLASSSGVHVNKTGLYAWDSHLVWIGALVAIGVQYWTDTTILWHNIRHMAELQIKREPITSHGVENMTRGKFPTV